MKFRLSSRAWIWTEAADWQPALWLDTFWQLINFVLTFSERRERTPGKVLRHLWRDQRKFPTAREGEPRESQSKRQQLFAKACLPRIDPLLLQRVFSLYVVWNNCICSLLDWCTVLCTMFIASPHEDNPIIIPSFDVRTELLVWRFLVKIVHSLKLFISALVAKLLTEGFIARTKEKPGECLKVKSRSKICTTWHWTMIQEIKETVAF